MPVELTGDARQQKWLFRTWGEEAVAFDSASGDTHFLQPLTLALYQTYSQNPGLSEAETIDLLSTRMSARVDRDFLQRANEALTSLQRIGLLQIP